MQYTTATAFVSECGLYRYALNRHWVKESHELLVFLMLNPSTADGTKDDNTIKKCVSIAANAGFGGIRVLNLFAFRATDCRELRSAANPTGNPHNDATIVMTCDPSTPVVCAWGRRSKFNSPRLMSRAEEVKKLLRERKSKTYCLKLTNDGDPYHPLMLPGASPLVPWPIEACGEIITVEER